MTGLRKAGSNWVDGDRFFDRESELEALAERVRDGTHTLLTAQRRMGKTSLVRELLRRLAEEGEHETVFVDLEAANDAADAVCEIALEARSIQGVWSGIRRGFTNIMHGIGDRIEEVELADLRFKLRAGVNAGNWRQQGDKVFAALAESDKPVVLAIDELPILVSRILKGGNQHISPERRDSVDQLLSWIRRNGQAHRDQVSMVVSGSVGLEPILRQAGLSAHANIFAPFELPPWSPETASACLEALAQSYEVDLPREVRGQICNLLRCCVPHHVQRFFDHIHEHLRRERRGKATVDDASHVYRRDLLSVRGQIDMEHYEGRLRSILDSRRYELALNLLTEAATNDGVLTSDAIRRYGDGYGGESAQGMVSIDDVLYTLEHDGYLERRAEGYRFVSGLLEDWWRARHGAYFTSIFEG